YRYQPCINDFSQLIRFDYRDILADTNEVEYGVVNRLYSKKSKSAASCYRHPEYMALSATLTDPGLEPAAPAPTDCGDTSGPAHDLISWTIAQKYFANPTFGGALVPGQRNVFDATVDFTGI